MNKNLFLPVLVFCILASCNDSGTEKKTTETAGATTHGDMSHTATGAGVPALPAVPEGANVFFINLKEGAEVSSPVKIEMGANLIKVDTAGPVIAGAGHHHVLVDGGDSLSAGTIIPMDSLHYHFGKAQTSAEIKLTPGKHKLTLQFADGLHRSYGSKMASTVTVNVK